MPSSVHRRRAVRFDARDRRAPRRRTIRDALMAVTAVLAILGAAARRY